MGLLQVPEDVHRQTDERGQAAGHVLWNGHHCLERPNEGFGPAYSRSHVVGGSITEGTFHAAEEATSAGATLCLDYSGERLSLITKQAALQEGHSQDRGEQRTQSSETH